MNKTPFIVFGIFAAICVLVIPIVALGKEGDEDAGTVKVASRDREAQQLFATNCGTCHTLAAGGTDGVVGPNLDMLLVPSAVNSAQQFDGNLDPRHACRHLRPQRAGCPAASSSPPRRRRSRSSSPRTPSQIGEGPYGRYLDRQEPAGAHRLRIRRAERLIQADPVAASRPAALVVPETICYLLT